MYIFSLYCVGIYTASSVLREPPSCKCRGHWELDPPPISGSRAQGSGSNSLLEDRISPFKGRDAHPSKTQRFVALTLDSSAEKQEKESLSCTQGSPPARRSLRCSQVCPPIHPIMSNPDV